MQIFGKLFVILVASSGVLAGVLPGLGGPDRDNDNCPDGSRRNPATAISQAGPQPYCASYVRTSVCTVTTTFTTTVPKFTTKTECKETDVTTTVEKTNTATAATVRVTTKPTVTTITTTTSVTTITEPHTTTVTQPLKRNNSPPRPTPPATTKCSCILLTTTTTVSSTVTKTMLSTITITTTKFNSHTKLTTKTTTLSPTIITTVPTTSTATTIIVSTQTLSTTTTATIFSTPPPSPSPCTGDLTAPPVNLDAFTLSHPKGTYTSIYNGHGLASPSIMDCCIKCYSNPGCIDFNFANFDPLFGNEFDQNYCQVFVSIATGAAVCSVPQGSFFTTYTNPALFGAGPADFFYSGAGPCNAGIDHSTIG